MITLKRFKVKGFKNFKDEIVFELANPGKYDFNNELIKNKIINKGIIYGKNGSGKSNLGEALFDIDNNLMALGKGLKFLSPFSGVYKNVFSNENPRFSYCFDLDGTEVEYSYTKINPQFVMEEELKINGEIVLSYSCEKPNNIFSKIPNTENLNFKNMTRGISPLLYIYRTVKFSETSPITKLFRFVEGMLWFRYLNKGNQFSGFPGQSEFIEKAIIEKNKVKDFQNFLENIADIHYELVAGETGQIDIVTGEKQKAIFAIYNGSPYLLSALLSTGTEALELFYYWQMSFNNIRFLFIDDFDAFYHYELSEKIITLLNKNSSFQSFVTTHCTSLMTNELSRPDCLFLMSENKIKPLCDCTDKELSKGYSLEKIYHNKGFDY